MELHFTGIIIAVSTFLIIGIFHPIVIKTEYYWGTRPWWLFFVGGILAVCLAITVENVIASSESSELLPCGLSANFWNRRNVWKKGGFR